MFSWFVTWIFQVVSSLLFYNLVEWRCSREAATQKIALTVEISNFHHHIGLKLTTWKINGREISGTITMLSKLIWTQSVCM